MVDVGTLMVPSSESSVMPRFELIDMVAVTARVPPLRMMWSATTDPGTAPRFRSVAADNVPPVMVVPAEYVLVPEKVAVPAPDLVRRPEPATTPPYDMVAPLSMEIVLADCNVMPRFAASVNEPVACSVPPFRVSRSATRVAAAPRLLSLEIATVP